MSQNKITWQELASFSDEDITNAALAGGNVTKERLKEILDIVNVHRWVNELDLEEIENND